MYIYMGIIKNREYVRKSSVRKLWCHSIRKLNCSSREIKKWKSKEMKAEVGAVFDFKALLSLLKKLTVF